MTQYLSTKVIKQIKTAKLSNNQLSNLCDLINQYNNFKIEKIPFKRSILLQGIPGVGKTTIVNGLIKKILGSNKKNPDNKITILKFASIFNKITEFYPICK